MFSEQSISLIAFYYFLLSICRLWCNHDPHIPFISTANTCIILFFADYIINFAIWTVNRGNLFLDVLITFSAYQKLKVTTHSYTGDRLVDQWTDHDLMMFLFIIVNCYRLLRPVSNTIQCTMTVCHFPVPLIMLILEDQKSFSNLFWRTKNLYSTHFGGPKVPFQLILKDQKYLSNLF